MSLIERRSFQSLRVADAARQQSGEQRIAYVLWSYPVLTETFVRREIEGLRDAGVHIDVFAEAGASHLLVPDAGAPIGPVTYFGPPDTERGRAATHAFLRRNPALVVRLYLFIVGHRYRAVKKWWHDRDVLYLSAQLAEVMKQNGITHVHAPWADQTAIIAFVASRLIGIGFSVQARAADIHRVTQTSLVADRLRFADFVVTNSRYNERYLKQLAGSDLLPPVHVICNGLDLTQFPRREPRAEGGVLRLLSVGRLVEPKGFRHLLVACRILRDRGVDFTCEIIGGPRDPDDTVTWVELRKLHQALDLETTVCFTGSAPFAAILSALHRADVFVLPCVHGVDGAHDITPNSLIEAMAMGLPVISTTTGAIPEIVDHGISGLLVPPGDEFALADSIARLLDDSTFRRTLGEAARQRVEEKFDIARNTPARAALFQRSRTRPRAGTSVRHAD